MEKRNNKISNNKIENAKTLFRTIITIVTHSRKVVTVCAIKCNKVAVKRKTLSFRKDNREARTTDKEFQENITFGQLG
jgi:hypothetical protein